MLLGNVLKLVDASLPFFVFIVLVDDWLNYHHELVLFLFWIGLSEHWSLLCEDSKFCLDGFDDDIFDLSFENVRHDSNQHVQHGDLCEESGTEEHEYHKIGEVTLSIGIKSLEISKREEILIE